ncbi:MAG TPA: glycosyltransferase family 4 protein [Candidatus Paceibacterota bacterium]
MKRVLIFSLTYHPFIGGAEVALKEITDRLDPTEFEFEMITLRFDSNLPRVEKVGNILVHRIGFSSAGARVSDRSMPLVCKIAKVLFPLTAYFKAISLDRKKHPPQGRAGFDIAWAMMANQAGFASLFFKLTYPRVKYFLELQDGRPFGEMKSRRPSLRFVWWLYHLVYLKANSIKCISTFIATEVRKIGYRGPVRVIPNGVDVKKFSAPLPETTLDELKKRFNKQSGDVFLFTASRLVLSRGVEDVIQALSLLPQSIKFLIAGTGEDREKLEHIARELGVFDRVIFAGYVSHDDLPAYLKISDIFVRPSLIEGMGNAFIEAFAAGVPVIGTPVGGIPDFLFDPEKSQELDKNAEREPTGLFCEVQNPESIARAVQRYMDEQELRERIVENAKRLVAEKYDWSLIARDMKEKIFDQL